MTHFFIAAFLFIAGAVLAPANTLTEQEKTDGFALLFDGQSIDRAIWSNTDTYTVKDGALVCKPGGQFHTKKEYADFVFRFQFRFTNKGANNGVGIRYTSGNPAYTGMEIQILDNRAPQYYDAENKKDKLAAAQYHGSIYQVVAAKRNLEKNDYFKPLGEWNEEEILADGSHIKVTLNGEVIVDADIKDIVVQGHGGLHNKSGYIGFLGHGDPVEFRNVRVKELTK